MQVKQYYTQYYIKYQHKRTVVSTYQYIEYRKNSPLCFTYTNLYNVYIILYIVLHKCYTVWCAYKRTLVSTYYVNALVSFIYSYVNALVQHSCYINALQLSSEYFYFGEFVPGRVPVSWTMLPPPTLSASASSFLHTLAPVRELDSGRMISPYSDIPMNIPILTLGINTHLQLLSLWQ